MTTFLSTYGTCEGPLGLPCTDPQAHALEQTIKALPEDNRAVKYTLTAKAPSELMEGERADVSWISEESPDRDHEIVLAKGMDDSHFKANPLVTLQHNYSAPPVGRSIWRKKVKDGDLNGIKAKTKYPTRPDDWPESQSWGPDTAFTLIKSKLLNGKSIGFIPLESRYTDDQEREKPGMERVSRIISKWLLLEYACCFIPCQQNATVEEVSKSKDAQTALQSLSAQLDQTTKLQLSKLLALNPADLTAIPAAPKAPDTIPFTNLDTITKHIQRELAKTDPNAIAAKIIQDRLDLARGRV